MSLRQPGKMPRQPINPGPRFIAKPAPVAVILQALQIPATSRPARPSDLPDDALIVRPYSAVLVAKLEGKNTELQQALEGARRATTKTIGTVSNTTLRAIRRAASVTVFARPATKSTSFPC
jgi:hypothetical protein